MNLDILKEIIKTARQTHSYSYEELFNRLGLKDKLWDMYIIPSDLTVKFRDFFMNEIKNFIKEPLYKDLSLKEKGDLLYLKHNDDFKEYLDDSIKKLKLKLKVHKEKVKKFLKKHEKGEEISLEDLIKNVKLDRVSTLLVLDLLKDEDFIYDYNGREVTY